MEALNQGTARNASTKEDIVRILSDVLVRPPRKNTCDVGVQFSVDVREVAMQYSHDLLVTINS